MFKFSRLFFVQFNRPAIGGPSRKGSHSGCQEYPSLRGACPDLPTSTPLSGFWFYTHDGQNICKLETEDNNLKQLNKVVIAKKCSSVVLIKTCKTLYPMTTTLNHSPTRHLEVCTPMLSVSFHRQVDKDHWRQRVWCRFCLKRNAAVMQCILSCDTSNTTTPIPEDLPAASTVGHEVHEK